MPIRLGYRKCNNFGDALNEPIFRELLGVDIRHSEPMRAELLGIGSILHDAVIAWRRDIRFMKNTKRNWPKYRSRLFASPPLAVWGSGFITDAFYALAPYRPVEVLALRGELSRALFQRALNRPIADVPMGDPGLLLSRLFTIGTRRKTVPLGIIAHYSDAANPLIDAMARANPGARVINILDPPRRVVGQIARCQAVVSTALHGLIAADSLGIANQWIVVSDRVRGGGFKFRDYYSAFGRNAEALDMRQREDARIDREAILAGGAVPHEQVVEVGDRLCKAIISYCQRQGEAPRSRAVADTDQGSEGGAGS